MRKDRYFYKDDNFNKAPKPKRMIVEIDIDRKIKGFYNNKGQKIFSQRIDGLSYAHTESHTLAQETYVNGGELMYRQTVVKRLSKDAIIENVFTYQLKDTDFFIVVLGRDNGEDRLRLADIYWELYDELDGYSFEFEPISKSSFSVEKLPSNCTRCY